MEKDYLQLALAKFNTDKVQWYGWRKDYTGDKRMSYENLILNDETATMPTEAEVNAKIQEIKDDEAAYKNNRVSGKTKLKTGEALTDAEVEALFG